MSSAGWWMIGGLGAGLMLAAIVWPGWKRKLRAAKQCSALKLFQQRREWLEARFLTVASQSGKPRGLRWSDCDFENGVRFGRDRNTDELRAFIGVTIKFEAIENGGMEDVAAVDNRKVATAVFGFDGKEWTTDGRAVFNLNPDETLEHFQHELVT